LNTVENTPATLQAGEMVAIPTGRMTGFPDNRGGLSRQMVVERQSVGTLYSATARRTSSGKILVELKIEQTKLSPAAPSASEADEMPRTPGTQQLTFSTSVLLKSGEPEVLASWQTLSSEGPVQEVILLQASVQE
jgi:type II secretory pathway component GspD/PulD (secretin)